jgi:glycerophosphoryl diester phosphodiesterase
MMKHRICCILVTVFLFCSLNACAVSELPGVTTAATEADTTTASVSYDETTAETTEPAMLPEVTETSEAVTEPEFVYTPWYETSRLIYHAGGEIKGISYTNSKEAVEKTLIDGNRLLEIDFLFTSDGHLVCLHEWQNLQGLSRPCTLDKFLSMQINYQFTTITAADIISYMRDYPDMFLIIDTKETDALGVVAELLRLCDEDSTVADRFVIQLYDAGIKAQCLELYPFGDDNFLFTAYKFGPYRYTDILNLCLEENICIVTVPYGSFDAATVQRFTAAGCLVFEHTVNYTSMTENGLKRGVYGFYTDSLREEDLNIPQS